MSKRCAMDRDNPPRVVVVTVDFRVSGQRLHAELRVPTGPTPASALLPVLQPLANAVVDVAVESVESKGERISCRKGCGACCRQLVPLSSAEAYYLALLVESLPEPRRSLVKERFALVVEQIKKAGLYERLQDPHRFSPEQLQSLGLEYFRLGLACPFLEEESCSIHSERPLACREYLVTSPASACAQPAAETIRQVPLPARLSRALLQLRQVPGTPYAEWTALTLALEWVRSHPGEPAELPGPRLLQELFQRLVKAGTQEGAPASGGGERS